MSFARPYGRSPTGIAILVLLSLVGCGQGAGPTPTSGSTTIAPKPKPAIAPRVATTAAPANSPFRFTELETDSGINFIHVSGMTADRHFPTANGSGVAILDYDGDGKMDLYFASCNLLPLDPKPKASNRLYKNLGDGKFQDVTEKAGVDFHGFCHGLIAADLDNDGDTDLILCNYGPNVLYLNNGDGTFKDVSKQAGISVPNWSSGGAVLDFDNDGDLDVYITNYGRWDINVDGKTKCDDNAKKIRQYCSPVSIATVRHIFYQNDGVKDGVPHFTNVTENVGLGRTDGHGFGAVSCDLNGDGKIDLFIANDQNPSFVYLNNGDGTFLDFTAQSGADYDENGKTQSGMGVDAEDVDGDGLPDLIRTNFREETTSLYMNQGKALFLEQSAFFGIRMESLPAVKWGCGLVDFDNDGFPDLFVTNGHVDDNNELVGTLNQPYREPPLLFHNDGGKTFVSARRGAGPYFEGAHVGRGAAFGDLDDDGRMDIVVNHKEDSPGVLLNRTDRGGNHWVRLLLKGAKSNRDAIGAKIEVVAGGRTIFRQKKGGGSMESTNDPRLLIGVGSVKQISKIVIHWPSGSADSILENVAVDQTHIVQEPATRPAG
ncbi:MAG: hypothetical protein JWN86_4519 [Planctomycetota bacterium]|nr:hypothetical protein [Planctomycetota bacterium]